MLTGTNAFEVIKRHQTAAPVDVSEIARDLGMNVWESRALGWDISGKLFPDPVHGGTSGYSILVNTFHALTRKRFTVAHEIGHFIMHRNDIASGIEDDVFYRSPLGGRRETEANRIAADILMPFGLIQQLQRSGVSKIEDLAEALGVSTQAMSIRLGIPVV